MSSLEIDLDYLRRKVEILSPANSAQSQWPTTKKSTSHTSSRARIKDNLLEAKLFQNPSINTAHLLLCILRNENDPTTNCYTSYKLIMKL
ncbi:MAG: hypothetical protein CM15mP32_2130 [Flavobacteriaceae bacterium]|nr:MAG: hypothetical protein CM15mP32_2130 [Flavobacteriaceae bacterium]